MAKMKFELNLKGLNELMKSEEMEEALTEAGEAVAKSAGEDYAVSTHKASYVAIANVYPTTTSERFKNLKTNVLLKALGTSGLPMTKG